MSLSLQNNVALNDLTELLGLFAVISLPNDFANRQSCKKKKSLNVNFDEL